MRTTSPSNPEMLASAYTTSSTTGKTVRCGEAVPFSAVDARFLASACLKVSIPHQ